MAKWNLDTIEADMAEIRASVDKLQEINRLQAGTIEWLTDAQRHDARALQKAMDDIEALREQLRQAQQSLRNARDSAIEEVAQDLESIGEPIGGVEKYPANFYRMYERNLCIDRIRSLKSTTQGSRE